MEKGNICGVAQLYVCPKYEEGQEPDVRVISVELFVSLYNNGALPDPYDEPCYVVDSETSTMYFDCRWYNLKTLYSLLRKLT